MTDAGSRDAGSADAGAPPASTWVPELFDLPVPVRGLPRGFQLVVDVDGDGRLDAVQTGYASPGYYVAIALAQLDGGYALTFDAGFGGNGATGGFVTLTRDLDRDGKRDLVVTDQLSNGRTHLFRGDGAGRFASVGSWRTTGTVDDLNRDGQLEAYSTGAGLVFQEKLLPDGGLGPYVTYPAYGGNGVVPGDFNGDSLGDLYLNEANRVYLGLPDGGLSIGPANTCSSCTGFGQHVATADVDQDGVLDVVTARSSLSIRRGNRDGGLDELFSTALGYGGAAGLAVGDLDGDGRTDVVLSEAVIGVTSNDLTRVFFQEAGGGWTAGAPYYNTGLGGRPTHVVDVDRDGLADALMNGDTAILNRGGRELRAPSLSRVTANFYADELWVDFDRDGRLDLALWGNGTFTIYPMGPGRRFAATPTTCNVAPRKPNETRLLADLTGDGIVDAYTILLGQLDIYVGQGGCGFAPVVTPLTQVYGPLRDVNGDGRADLVNWAGTGVPSYLSTGTATFGAAVPNALPDDADDLRVEDWSGDGKPDLLLRWSGSSRRVLLAQGDGMGHFTAGLSFTYAMGVPSAMAVGDADGDGDPDVVVAVSGLSTTSTAFELWRNDGAAGVTRVPTWLTHASNAAVNDLRFADLDLDGRAELLVLTNQNEVVYSLVGGAHVRVSIPGASGVLTDADGDGDLDLVGYRAYDSAMGFVYRNRTRD